MSTPTISEAARRAFLDAYAKACQTSRPEDWHKAALLAKQWDCALDSAHPAPKEGATPETDAVLGPVGRIIHTDVKLVAHARSLELRLSEAKNLLEHERTAKETARAENSVLDKEARSIITNAPDEDTLAVVSRLNRMLSEAKREVEALKASVAFWKKDSAAAWDKCEEHRSHLNTANELLREAHAMFLPPESDFGHTPPKAALLSRIRTHLNQQSK